MNNREAVDITYTTHARHGNPTSYGAWIVHRTQDMYTSSCRVTDIDTANVMNETVQYHLSPSPQAWRKDQADMANDG